MLTRRNRSSRSSTRAGAVRGASNHLLSLSGVGVLLALFAQGLASCGSDDDEGGDACEAGELRACAGPGMCAGNQTCASDGSAYSECSCGSGNAGSSGVGGSAGGSNGGAAGAGGSGPIQPTFDPAERAVGAPCTTDAECPEGPNGEVLLTCITPTTTTQFGTGSPQGGYCTARCRETEECQALDGLAACGLLDEAGDGYCIALCQPGTDPEGVKCGPDRAQACFQFPMSADPIGACFPVCQSDAACGAGQFCDFGATGLGLCTTTQPAGGDVGAPCTTATAATDCRSGTCVTLIVPETGEEAGSFCSANCTFGLVEGCGFGAQADTPVGTRDAVCIRPQRDDGGPGDVGFCFELCNADADCAQADEGWVCVQDLTPAGQMLVGRTGECVPPLLADGALVDAGN